MLFELRLIINDPLVYFVVILIEMRRKTYDKFI